MLMIKLYKLIGCECVTYYYMKNLLITNTNKAINNNDSSRYSNYCLRYLTEYSYD